MITVYPTYGQYIGGYLITPMVSLMLLGGVIGLVKLKNRNQKPIPKTPAPKKKKIGGGLGQIGSKIGFQSSKAKERA